MPSGTGQARTNFSNILSGTGWLNLWESNRLNS
jgi:hypothetical protein